MDLQTKTNISADSIEWLKRYHRLTNYIGAAQLYLQDNYLLESELEQEHIKERILGHWGTVPGINLLYGAINWTIKKYDLDAMFIVGSGHGAPAMIANLFVEGSLTHFYPEYTHDKSGMGQLIHDFSWPDKFPSHSGSNLPGTIHEGGELGYSLGTAFGAVFDNPDLTVFVEVGDGEAETGPLAASWQSNKFLNPLTDGAVVPIVNINGYKISNPTLMSTMSDEELMQYFEGLGYAPLIVDQYKSEDIYADILSGMSEAIELVRSMQFDWRNKREETIPRWPVILFRNKKGWTGPKKCKSRKLEDNCYSHGIPLKYPRTDEEEFTLLVEWLTSYRVNDFLNEEGEFVEELFEFNPPQDKLLGMSPDSLGGVAQRVLSGIDYEQIEHSLAKRGENGNTMIAIGGYLCELMKANPEFRIFSPDESESNKIDKVFEFTHKQYIWPVCEHDKYIAKQGQVLEILSEHVLQGWMTGYTLTGRRGVLISYEAFLSIIVSQIDQHIKFFKKSREFSWRRPVPSLNYISTSTAWIQEHNGFSHQNPALLSTLLCKQDDLVNLYFPADANTALVTMQECVESSNSVNVVTCSKRDLPQWLSLEEAQKHVERGVGIWEFASHDDPDVVLCSIGDTQTQEVLAGIKLLKQMAPKLRIRYVNVNELTALGLGSKEDLIDTREEFEELFTEDKPVVINYHGYPQNIKQLLFGTPVSDRLSVLGYIEQGTTTTTFDMQVKNQTSRYHVAIKALEEAAKTTSEFAAQAPLIIAQLQEMIEDHKVYIARHGEDMPQIKNWKW